MLFGPYWRTSAVNFSPSMITLCFLSHLNLCLLVKLTCVLPLQLCMMTLIQNCISSEELILIYILLSLPKTCFSITTLSLFELSSFIVVHASCTAWVLNTSCYNILVTCSIISKTYKGIHWYISSKPTYINCLLIATIYIVFTCTWSDPLCETRSSYVIPWCLFYLLPHLAARYTLHYTVSSFRCLRYVNLS